MKYFWPNYIKLTFFAFAPLNTANAILLFQSCILIEHSMNLMSNMDLSLNM